MTSDDAFALLARENPIGDDDLPAAKSVEVQKLKARIMLTPIAVPRGSAVDARWRAPRRRSLIVATTAAAVVATTVITLPRALQEERLGASPAAAAVLEHAAQAASAYSGGRGGDYAYTKARTLYAATSSGPRPFTLLLPSVRETWVAADGSGRIVEVEGKPIFLGPRDRKRWQAAGSPLGERDRRDELVRAHYRAVPTSVLSSDPEQLNLEQLDQLLSAVPQLPTDADRLERIIRAYAEKMDPPFEAQMFNVVSGLLHSPYGSRELRAAAYRVLARIQGVALVGQRRDALGRLGTAISAPAGYGDPDQTSAEPEDGTLNRQQRRHLIIDPETGNVLAEETVLTKRVEWIDGEPGDVTGSITILAQSWVNSVHDQPEPGS